MCESLIFGNISNFDIKIKKKDLDLFKQVLNDELVPNEFIMQTAEGVFIVKKKEKVLRIFERKYDHKFLTREDIDFSTCIVSRIASKCGFTIYLDVKYSN